MRSVKLLCALVLAASQPDGLAAQEGAAPGASRTEVKVTSKKRVKKRAKPTGPPARELFGAAKTPAPLAARSIGFYAKGCLAGAAALPKDGAAWQAMRLSRNRNWGHPKLVALVKNLAVEAKEHDGWPGLLVGDISQPRGGPMLTGHASHQVGLDADIWLTPMPSRRLTQQEREDLSATSMLAADGVSVNPNVWTDAHVRLLKRAASYADVDRIFVHPAIKKALCDAGKDNKDRENGWLRKVRAYWGHYYHFHVRIACPQGSGNCEAQAPLGTDNGCGAELKKWLALIKPKPEVPPPPSKPVPRKPPITLDQLPAECRTVLTSGGGAAPVMGATPEKPAKPANASAK